MTVKSVAVSKDRRTVELTLADMRPAMQMQLRYNLNTAAGVSFSGELDHTIHVLPRP